MSSADREIGHITSSAVSPGLETSDRPRVSAPRFSRAGDARRGRRRDCDRDHAALRQVRVSVAINSASAGGNASCRELAAADPTHLLSQLRPRRATQLARKKVELDPTIRIVVTGRQDFAADDRRDVELLAEFALQARRQRLVRFALAARKFPEAFEVHARRPACDQKVPLVFDDRGGHQDRRHLSGENG